MRAAAARAGNVFPPANLNGPQWNLNEKIYTSIAHDSFIENFNGAFVG